MSKKALNASQITEELTGAVAQFAHSQPRPPAREDAPPPTEESVLAHSPTPSKKPRNQATAKPRKQLTKKPSNHDTMQPRNHDTTIPLGEGLSDDTVEAVRVAVKQLGKEAATYRFTMDEKKALADVVYTYKRSGIKTSENELTRIAINWALDDYRRNGQLSVLATVLERLRA